MASKAVKRISNRKTASSSSAPWSVVLTVQETTMLCAVAQAATAQMALPAPAADVIEYKMVAPLIGMTHDKNAKDSIKKFFARVAPSTILTDRETKLLWAIARISKGHLNVDYDQIVEVVNIVHVKNVKQSARKLFQKIGQPTAPDSIRLTVRGTKAPKGTEAISKVTADAETDDEGEGDETESLSSHVARNSARLSATKTAAKASSPQRSTYGGKTVSGGRIVRRGSRRQERRTLSSTYTSDDQDMNEAVDQDEAGAELNAISNNTEEETREEENQNDMDVEIPKQVNDNNEVEHREELDDKQAGVVAPEQPDLNRLLGVVQRAAAVQAASEPAISQVAHPGGYPGYPMVPYDPSPSVLFLHLYGNELRITQADLDASHRWGMTIYEYMSWKVANGFYY